MRLSKPLLCLLILFATCSFAQKADTTWLAGRHAATYPVASYKEANELSQNLYNGRIYFVYDSRQEEHQFYESRKWIKGSVYYDGQQYDSIPMLYDIYYDQLVIKHFYGDYMLLQTEKVRDFHMLGHHYVRQVSGREVGKDMRTAFYDKIYEGPTSAIVRRTKQRQEKIVDKRVISLYPGKNFYFVWKDGAYHSVHTKKSVLRLFPENQKQLRRALRDNQIKFRKQRESAIVTIVSTYDQLARK